MEYQSQNQGLEDAVQNIGRKIHEATQGAPPSLFEFSGVRGRLLAAAMRDDAMRSALFQFVDVLPNLDSPEAIARHFRAYFHGRALAGPWGKLLEAGEHPWAAWAVKRSVSRLARQFLAEESAGELRRVVARLARIPAEMCVDAVGEACLTEAEADAYVARNLSLLDSLTEAGVQAPHLSVKLSALTPRFDPADPGGSARRVLDRIEPLLGKVAARGAALTVDMEHHDFKSVILEVFRVIADRHRETAWLPGIALQAYRPDAERDLQDLIAWAREQDRRIGLRLVKGAYWDTEVAVAEARVWPPPVYLHKSETDAAYERLTRVLFDHADLLYPAIASHNLRSLAHAIACAHATGLSPGQWEVQMLYGMAEPLRDAVVRFGTRMRVYVPTGELLSGIAYLIRRLMENTASTSILRLAYIEGLDPRELLAAPQALAQRREPPERETGREGAEARFFSNTPLTDFSLPGNRAAFAHGLAAARGSLGRLHRLRIPGAPSQDLPRALSRNPADPEEILGEVELAGPAQAMRAVENALAAFPAWRDTPGTERIQRCLRAADILLERRHALAAWEILETGKNWREADADVAEAVDHLRYYGSQMLRLDGWHETRHFRGERNVRGHEPCGVAAVIAPWNFPIAILAGMTGAALAAGNTVIMKPASPARLCAHRLWEALMEAGFPEGVCQLLPGSGEIVGQTLATHPAVNVIAFTGSREVGLDILHRAHAPSQDRTHVKRVVCEMGGKNAIIVDEDADLDEAVAQVFSSAFGYQGQKCSACSRVITVGAVHDRFLARLAAMLECYPLGPPEDPQFVLGPLISAQAKDKAERYLETGKAEGRLHCRGRETQGGHYFAPAIFTGIEPHHRLAREEIFAPILSVLRARDFTEAIEMALDSDYALTGGVFSRLPEHLALARQRLRVGNLYLNRKITGALVAVQPFGGWRLSGTGVQAGGPDYLMQFLWSRVVSENTLRHGFVP